MKIIKVFFIIIIVWAVALYMLFGPAIIHKVANTPEIIELSDLHVYHGYTVDKLETDWFGNWIVIKKGLDEEVLKCSDSVFSQLSVGDLLDQ